MSIFVNNYYNVEDAHVSEVEKNGFDYLKKSVDYYISSLVHEKVRIRKARNLYEGVRDRAEFKFLEDTFGIETPIAVKMTPIIKTRIDVLLGLLLDDVFTYRITINDQVSLTQAENLKKNERAKRIIAAYKKQVTDTVDNLKVGQPPVLNAVDQKFIKRLEKSLSEEFISQFEIAAQSLLKFFEQDLTIDYKQKIKQFFLDLLIAGESYYRTYVDRIGEDPKFEICKPENIFYSKNTAFQFLSTGHQPHVNAIVHRYYLKRSEILTKWGHKMNETARNRIFGNYSDQGARSILDPRRMDYIYRQDDYYESGSIHNQHSNSNQDTLPVYHVEWLANNLVELTPEQQGDFQTVADITVAEAYKDTYGVDAGSGKSKKYGYRLDRYEGIRIGNDIYLELGKSEYAPRSEGQPAYTTLSYNGVIYNDRNGKPYSITLSLKDLQDKYDIIMFFRDNLIANAGVGGSRINLAGIPKVLGQNYMERLLKFLALRKQGVEVYDPTEDGANLFQHYGDFKGSLDPAMIQGLDMVLETIERQADMVTGVNRHMYAAAEVRDAVSNVQVGQKQVSLITKDLFELVQTAQKHALTDLLNRAKICYRKGKRGSYIVGHRTVLFDVQPENFCFTDYNIYIINSTKENLKMEKVLAIVPELVKMQVLDPAILIKVTLSDSPTDILSLITENMLEREKENDQLTQVMQQLQQLQTQMQEQQKQLENATKQLEAAEKAGDELRARDVAMREKETQSRIEVAEKRINLDERVATEEIAKDKMVVQLEREQLQIEVAGNAKEVRNDL